jgi:predicted CXXCH cytochrome family protein
MTQRWKLPLATLGLVLVVVVAGAVALRARSPAFVLSTIPMPAASGHVPSVLQGRGHALHVTSVGLACKDCHGIESDTFHRPGPEKCQGCHTRQHLTLHQSPAAPSEAKDCTACHSFLPRAGDDRDPWNCMRCHGQDQAGAAAVVVHRREECGQCHRPHGEPATSPKDCNGCHDGVRAKKHDPPPTRPCLDCHQALHQGAPKGSEACLGCHAQKQPRVPATAIFPGGHERCVSCHTTHEEKAGLRRACRECHAQEHVVGMERVPQHADCLSCHNQHNVLAGPSLACARCHEGQPHKDRSIDISRGCVACHNVHGSKRAVLTTTASGDDCAGCHTIAPTNGAFHSPKVVCASCHAEHGSNPKGPLVVKQCPTCHANKAEQVALNQGHADCRKCHVDKHRPLPIVAGGCAGCHAAEAQAMPKGHAEKNCIGCHDAHSGAKPSCGTCHQRETKATHGNLATGCETCHRPHGPKGVGSPPRCTSCHEPAKLPALHQVPQHAAACRACHVAPHDPPRADRVTCTSSCHTDRREHQPRATGCTGCHNFGGAP